MHCRSTVSALLLFGLATFSSSLPAAAPAGFKEIFNGQDLTGWEGLPFWSVKAGAIVGQTTPEKPTKGNTFLVYRAGQPANFELRATFRLTGQNTTGFANSGIQYRSHVVDAAAFVIGGYQADMDLADKYTGMLYEEKGRGILMTPGEKIRVGATTMDPATKKPTTAVEKLPGATPSAELHAAYKVGDWNDLVIIAEGNHLRHVLNGKLTADVIDNDPTLAAKSGVLALQLHAGQPMTIEFKNLYLKSLP